MAVTSDDLLCLSRRLLAESPCTEAVLRAAIGRAYYAVYYEALAAADALGLPAQKTNTGLHDQLISRFGAEGKRLKVIANRIAAAKMQRVDADYKIRYAVSIIDARKHLASCESIVVALAQLRASNTGT